MKRRILALILSLMVLMMAMPVPALSSETGEGEPPPVSEPTKAPDPTKAPETTTAPVPTDPPATDIPTQAPVETPNNEPTVEVTEEPTEAPSESATPDPEGTPDPEASPNASEEPEATPEPLKASLSVNVRSAFVGDSVRVSLKVSGGADEISVTYQVFAKGSLQSESGALSVVDGASEYTFQPKSLGDYTIKAIVTDGADQRAEASAKLPVAEHDTTSFDTWVARARGVKLTGDWREDILAVAESQLGYAESTTDFIIREDGSRQGYSVAGARYGVPYEEWCAMFVAFCADFAKIPTSAFPQYSSVDDMADAMKQRGVYHSSDSDYEPKAGDIIFFINNGIPSHVGIVRYSEAGVVYTIEGNTAGAVGHRSYSLGAAGIMGYGSMEELMVRYGVLTLAAEGPEADDIAMIENGDEITYYKSVQDAVDAVQTGQTIKMLGEEERANAVVAVADLTDEEADVPVPVGVEDKIAYENVVSSENKTYALDLNGWTIDGSRKASVFRITAGTVTIKNGTLTNGYAQGADDGYKKNLDGMGGGLFATGATITLEGMKITNNTANHGGGIALGGNENTTATIKNTEISGNKATAPVNDETRMVGGGGLYTQSGYYNGYYGTYYGDPEYNMGGNTDKVTLTNVKFLNNESASYGSAMNVLCDLTASDCEFSGNRGAVSTIFVGCEYSEMKLRTVRFTDCTIENNQSTSYTVALDLIDVEDYPTSALATYFSGGEISGNNAGIAGGIFHGTGNLYLSGFAIEENTATDASASEQAGGILQAMSVIVANTLSFSNTVVKGNHAAGSGAGGFALVPTTKSIQGSSPMSVSFSKSAIYDNTSANSDANDVYVEAFPTLYTISLPEADAMSDSGENFSNYFWRDTMGDESAVVTSADVKNATRNTYFYLTACEGEAGDVAKYDGENAPTISDAISRANTKNADVAEILLIAGKEGATFAENAFISETATVNLPVELNLNGREIVPHRTKANKTLFIVSGEGSLKLTGKGKLFGGVKVENGSSIELNSATNGFGITIEQMPEENQPVILLGGSFSIDSTKGLTIQLPAATLAELNKFNTGDQEILVPVFGKADGSTIALSEGMYETIFALPGLDNEWAKIEVRDDVLYVVNPVSEIQGYFVSSKGTDGADGSYEKPFSTLTEAVEALEDHNEKEENAKNQWNTIYIKDEDGYVLRDEDTELILKDPVVIERFSASSVASGKAMITIDSKEMTLGEMITIDGRSDKYTNGGSLVELTKEDSKLTIAGATLQNNDRSPVYGTVGTDYKPYSGGAVYAKAGEVVMTGGLITECSALLGGGIFIENGASFTMEGGKITGNNAEASLLQAGGGEYTIRGSGGAVCVYGKSKMIMEAGLISDNSAVYGGGIALGLGHRTNFESNRESFALTMNGGTLDGNKAIQDGGGLFVQGGYQAEIFAGYITNNDGGRGNFGGGGVYVNDNGQLPNLENGALYLHNVLIADNRITADDPMPGINASMFSDSLFGGAGIASCGTSGTLVGTSAGSMIFGNYDARGNQDDLLIALGDGSFGNTSTSGSNNKTPEVDVSGLMLDGTPYKWVGFSNDKAVTNSTLTKTGYVRAYTPVSKAATYASAATSGVTVFITGNTAVYRGAGIGSNGDVIIGDRTDAEIEVTKSWKDNEYPSDVQALNIWLWRPSDSEFIIYDELTEDEGFAGTVVFKNLEKDTRYIVLEEVILKDGTHVWSELAEGIDGYEEVNEKLLESIAEKMGDTPWFLSDAEESPYEGSIPPVRDGDTSVEIENETVPLGSLSISKSVTGLGDKDGVFTFRVTFTNDDGTEYIRAYPCTSTFPGEDDPETIKSGDTIKFTHGQTVTITNLPEGTNYTVVEIEANQDGYVTTATVDDEDTELEDVKGKIPADDAVAVVFTNDKSAGSVRISKTVDSKFDSDFSKSYTFTVSMKDTQGKALTGSYPYTINDGEEKTVKNGGTIELKHGETAVIRDLLVGTVVTVTEPVDAGFAGEVAVNASAKEANTSNALGMTATISGAEEPLTFAFTNTRLYGGLTVTKTVTGTAGDQTKEFTFTITLGDKSINGTFGEIEFKNGVATIKLKHGDEMKAEGLPAGITYAVKESDNEGYSVSGKATSGTIAGDKTWTAAFTNHMDEPTPTPAPAATPAPTAEPAPSPTPEMSYVSISGQKSWMDNDDALGLRPAEITVCLVRNGVVVQEQTVTAADNWSYSFLGLPALDAATGELYTYTISERLVSGYYGRTVGNNLVNTLIPDIPKNPGERQPEGFEGIALTAQDLSNLIVLGSYGVPLWGKLLGTGDTLPMYPFVFGGIGLAAVVALMVLNRKKKRAR